MLINLKSLSPVLVMISSMSLPICSRFHTTQANSGKLMSSGVPLFDALIRGESSHPVACNFVAKSRVLGAAHIEDFEILSCTVLIQYISVTDRLRTDRRPGHG